MTRHLATRIGESTQDFVRRVAGRGPAARSSRTGRKAACGCNDCGDCSKPATWPRGLSIPKAATPMPVSRTAAREYQVGPPSSSGSASKRFATQPMSPLPPKFWNATRRFGRIQRIDRPVVPEFNWTETRQTLRRERGLCIQRAALPSHLFDCLTRAIDYANAEAPPLDPGDAWIDPRTGTRFARARDSCSKIRTDAAEYLMNRDSVWPVRFQEELERSCSSVTELANAMGVPPSAFSVTAWIVAATGYYGAYTLPYEETMGCIAPDFDTPGSDSTWVLLSEQGRRGTPSNLGYYTLPPIVPLRSTLCALGRRNVEPRTGGIIRRALFGPTELETAVQRAIRAIREVLGALRAFRAGRPNEELRRALDCWFPGHTEADLDAIEEMLQEMEGALEEAIVFEYTTDTMATGYPGVEPDDITAAFDANDGRPAQALPGTPAIAVYPSSAAWRQPYFATILVHEAAHLAGSRLRFPRPVGHLPGSTYNAYRFQGFVSQVFHLSYRVANVAGHVTGASGCARP